MDKQTIIVPKGIKHLSKWKEFNLPEHPHILNKQITGCGFTEFCLRSDSNLKNVILCSPRRALLENKEKQHNNPSGKTLEEINKLKRDRGPVYYAKNSNEKILKIDDDLNTKKAKKEYSDNNKSKESIESLINKVKDYYFKCTFKNIPCKILVTYDSFRHVKEALKDHIEDFFVIVDEMQSIFVDSKFKSDTEIEFQSQLRDLNKVCYVSATPMIDKYLEMIPEFKDLPYYEFDWKSEDPGRVKSPIIRAHKCSRLNIQLKNWIDKYKSGNFDKKSYVDENGDLHEILSKELVIYVNSVSNICNIIKSCNLSPDECNILCSDTPDNLKKIKQAFKKNGYGYKEIGTIPEEGEEHKMFTICTRTVYLGADFYSTNAQSIVFSDASIDCLAVDISLDLPQILGRQRLDENPWKNELTLYYKTNMNIKSSQEFSDYISNKIKKSHSLLNAFNLVNENNPEDSYNLAETYLYTARAKKYKDDYVAVNQHGGSSLIPVFNNLVMVSELRSFEIQQIDYADRFSVLSALEEKDSIVEDDPRINKFISIFNKITVFTDKLKYLCEFIEGNKDIEELILKNSSVDISNYYNTFGPDICKKYSYRKYLLDEEYNRLKMSKNKEFLDEVYSEFSVDQKYTCNFIKEILQNLYNKFNISKVAKSTDIKDYFEVERTKISNKETGKRDEGFKLIKRKEN